MYNISKLLSTKTKFLFPSRLGINTQATHSFLHGSEINGYSRSPITAPSSKKSIYFFQSSFGRDHEHAWYCFDISNDNNEKKKKIEDGGSTDIIKFPRGKFATRLDPFLVQDLPDMSVFTSIGSTIYCLGGNESLLQKGWPVDFYHDKQVYCLDTKRPNRRWVKHPSKMLAARSWPSRAVLDGKLYLMGGSRDKSAPWGEVFDPTTGVWEPLPHPPFKPYPPHRFDFPQIYPHHDKKKILLPRNHAKDLCSFDVTTKTWQMMDNNFESFDDNPFVSPTGVATDDTMYWFTRQLYAYDLREKVWYKGPLKGWNHEGAYHDEDGNLDPYMFHFGGNQFCLVWEDYTDRGTRIHCSKFRVLREKNFVLNAFVECTKSIFIEGQNYQLGLLVSE